MDPQPTANDKQKVLRGDFLFACSMFIVFCIYLTGLMATPFWEYDQRQKIVSANATSTAFAVGTKQANATATAIAHATAQAQYSIIDTFKDNGRYWLVESIDDEYMVGSIAINGGIYAWNIREVKQPFVYWANYPGGNLIKDFDTYVDFKVVGGAPEDVCSGFVFRMASNNWEKGAYTFSACNNSYFYVHYYEQGKWETIADQMYSNAIRNFDWNRLEINARGDHFTFIINNQAVFEMTDDRQTIGGLALLVEINEKKPTIIWFDNFGLQSY